MSCTVVEARVVLPDTARVSVAISVPVISLPCAVVDASEVEVVEVRTPKVPVLPRVEDALSVPTLEVEALVVDALMLVMKASGVKRVVKTAESAVKNEEKRLVEVELVSVAELEVSVSETVLDALDEIT